MKPQTLLPLATVASAHTIMQSFNGQPQGSGIYMPSDPGFISDVTSNSMACNGAPVGYFTSSSDVHTVEAGSEVTGAWLHTLTSTGPDEFADNKVIDSSHKGPVSMWMKKVDDATANPFSGPGDGWFKISEDGYTGGRWGVDNLIAAEGIQNATIPSCIANGDYLVRFEILALHSAGDLGEAQFYMECAQVRVTGGTDTETPDTVSIPGVYKADDPGILVFVWNNVGQPYPDSYSVPGPRPFQCSGSPSEGNPPAQTDSPSETETPVEAESPVETETPVEAEAPVETDNTEAEPPVEEDIATEEDEENTPDCSSGNDDNNASEEDGDESSEGGSAAAALYGQCGGNGWTGPTTCSSGTCKKSNDWYSQCVL